MQHNKGSEMKKWKMEKKQHFMWLWVFINKQEAHDKLKMFCQRQDLYESTFSSQKVKSSAGKGSMITAQLQALKHYICA